MPVFAALISEAKSGKEALTGTWLTADGDKAGIQMPLSSMLCSGLRLEPMPGALEAESMSVDALKAELKGRGLQCIGQKSALSSRLATSVGATGAVTLYRGRRLTAGSVLLLRDYCRPYDLGL